MAGKANVRALAATVVAAVSRGQSLTTAIQQVNAGGEQALLQAMAYGVIRYWYRLDALAGRMLDKPLKSKDLDVQALILCGLYQLLYMRIPPHAAVSETVNATAELGKPWSRKLVNAILRKFQRESEHLLSSLEQDPQASSLHPRWLLDRLHQDWPERAGDIIAANNAQAPMSLRVNLARGTRGAYLRRLEEAGIGARAIEHTQAGIELGTPVDVQQLPGFADGLVSVQDAAAQQAAVILDAQPGQRVLDACAAPGGKTAHILERLAATGGQADVVAVDMDSARLARVGENLERLGLAATLVAGSALKPADWFDGARFDRILLDAPCSATGVIRRHPDIRLLRRETDIARLAGEQARMLETLWALLAPGGRLLYATCSVLRQENSDVVAAFLARHADASEEQLEPGWGVPCQAGRQIITGERDMDGFYYASLRRQT